jgi:predicted glutamine amidotransferase
MANGVKDGKKPEAKAAAKPVKTKKLSKAGEWRRANPDGIGLVIYDMRAVMK